MKNNKRKILAILVTAVLFILVLFLRHAIISGFSGGEPGGAPGNPGERPPAVETVNAVETDIADYLALTGTVEPYRVARLASPAEGPVMDMRVREGDAVRKGDALLFIGRKQGADTLVESLRVAREKAADELSRTRGLVEQDALPGEALDEARVAYEKARAELARAEEAASDHVIAAPWAGIVRDVLVREGGFVSPHTALLEIYDPASLVIRVGIPERYANAVTVGMQVEIRLDARSGEAVKGRVERLYPYLDVGLRTRTAEIVPTEETPLLPGMFARLRLILEMAENAVVVPMEAVWEEAGETIVFVVEEGKAVQRPVETGIEVGGRVQVLSGVAKGEAVIIAGAQGLRHGDPVSASAGGSPGAIPGERSRR